MESSKTKIESFKTISNAESTLNRTLEGAKTAKNVPASQDGQLRCFQLVDEEWRSKQFMPNVQTVSIGAEGMGNEIEISGDDVDNQHMTAKKFNGRWYLMEVGKKDLTRVNGVPARQAVLALNESVAVSIGGNPLVFDYSMGRGGNAVLTAGHPGPSDFHIEDSKGLKFPFSAETACLVGANPLCGLCTGATLFLDNFTQSSDKHFFKRQFIGVFSVINSRLMFASFDESLTLDGKPALSPQSVSDGSELAVGQSTIKLNVPSELTGPEPVEVPDSPGESVLALLPVSDPNNVLPDIEIPASMRSITIGRSSKVSDVVILEPNLSRKHSQCIIYDKTIMLFDCGSSNGTFVNGEKITKKTIHLGDTVSFGDVSYFFCYAG
ncbi:MAG: FHA domain-containing protein [Kiritimatiellaeota bacterium]|nr:FHA domain-containing protein [Kiritimatiellota bacterium]